MNIFVTSPNPISSAIALDDKRVIKMILESCQMLNTTILRLGGNGIGYKPTHQNHPCTLWVKESFANFEWLRLHMLALCREYSRRYNKTHACQRFMKHFREESKQLSFDHRELTVFVNCCTDFKDEQNVFTAYQKQLNKKMERR